LAHRQSHAFSLAATLLRAFPVFDLRREWLALQQQAEAAIAVCRGKHLRASCAGNDVSRIRTCPTGTNRERNCADARGFGRLVGHGGQPIPTVVSLSFRRGMRGCGTLRGTWSFDVPVSKRRLAPKRKQKNTFGNPSRLHVNKKPDRSS